MGVTVGPPNVEPPDAPAPAVPSLHAPLGRRIKGRAGIEIPAKPPRVRAVPRPAEAVGPVARLAGR